jgi:hypothetical protein
VDASEQIPTAGRELCVRCKQPLSLQHRRCRNCGQPVSGLERNLPLLIGIGGVGAIVFVVLLMWLVVHNEDVLKRPVRADEEPAAQQTEMAPEASKTADKEPPKPEKAPPLNR